MPPLPALDLPMLVELERSLRAGAPATLIAIVQRAEDLAAALEPDRDYPDEWVLYRLMGDTAPRADRPTARRPSAPPAGAPLQHVPLHKGSEILRQLPGLVERLCVHAQLSEDALAAAGALRAQAILKQWDISRKTLDRLRRRGLIARRALAAQSRHVLLFMPTVVAAFERTHAQELQGAADFSRLTESQRADVLAEFQAMRRERAVSITAGAKAIAQRHGRSAEGIRLFLKSALKKSAGSPESESPVGERTRRAILRASRAGLDLDRLSTRLGRTRPAVRHAVTLARAEALRRLADDGGLITPVAPTFDRPDAAEVLLAGPAVREGLGARGEADLQRFIDAARHSPPPTGAAERARLIACQYLRFDAGRRLGALDRLHPKAPEVDAIETLLRWASRLKVEILRPHLRLVLETIEGRFGRKAEEIPPRDLVQALRACLAAACRAVDEVDAARGGRAAGSISLGVDRVVAELARAHPLAQTAKARRAATLLAPGTLMADWTLSVSPWQRWLEPDPRVRDLAERAQLPDTDARFLSFRFGWRGEPPMTLAHLAHVLDLTPIRVSLREQKALESARGALRTLPPK